MFGTRYSRLRRTLDPFLLGVALLSSLATALAITPSSYGLVLRTMGAQGDGVLLGEPRTIRSDEYALWTPMLQAAEAGGYGQINESSIYGESQRNFYAMPLRDWGLFFKPPFWPFLVLPAPFAYAGYFALQTFLFLAGYYLLSQRFGSSRLDAGLIALLLYYSSYTQSWWTSLGYHLAIFPWIFLLFLAEMRPTWRFLAVTLATGAWFLTGTFYPPLVWSLLLSGLLALWVFRPESLRLLAEQRKRQLAMLLGLAAGALAAYLYLAEPLAAALASTGHGQRDIQGGQVAWQNWLGLFFPFFPFRGLAAEPNFCEASSGGSYLWLLLLVFLDYRRTWQALAERPERRELLVRAAALAAAFLFVSAWMLLPLPSWIGRPFLWDKFPNARLLYPAGLLSLWLVLLLLPHARFRAGWTRILAFGALMVTAWWPSRVAAPFHALFALDLPAALRLEWQERSNSDLYPLGVLPALALLAFALRRRFPAAHFLSGTTALALAALFNAICFFDWNPWMSARPIFDRPNTQKSEQLLALQEAHPQRWLVVGGLEYLAKTLNGYGFRSVNHGFVVPETRLLRELFPHLDPERFDFLFNRYSMVQVGLYDPPDFKQRLREPNSQLGIVAFVPAEAFLPETKIELALGPPAHTLPERGEIRSLHLDGKRLTLSFFGEINGTSGRTQVTIHLDRRGTILDRWLRPRTDAWNLEDGLRLFSRLDLEIELEDAPDRAADLGLCVVTQDPAFGSYAIAPSTEGRSLCP